MSPHPVRCRPSCAPARRPRPRRFGGVSHYVQRLHAVSAVDGSAEFGGPALIGDTSYDGSAYTYNRGPVVNGTVPFYAFRQLQRSALRACAKTRRRSSVCKGFSGFSHRL